MFGKRCVKTYSRTQETLALSSDESEFCGIVKAATMGLGMKGLMTGLEVEVQVNTDASAAKRIETRREGRGERCRRIDQTRGARENGLPHEGVRDGAEEW